MTVELFLKLYFGGFAIYYLILIKRHLVKKGPCLGVFHNYKVEWDSEEEKWKNGRMPLRVSVGGMTMYKCTKCAATHYESWSAF